MLVGKGKRGPDLLEARRVLPVSQEPIGLQGGRKRKTPRIEAPQPPPRPETVSRCAHRPSRLLAERFRRRAALEQVGRKPLNVTPLEAVFYIFHKHGGILHSWSSFAITGVIRAYKGF